MITQSTLQSGIAYVLRLGKNARHVPTAAG
jgi:hypothetical protein